MVLEGSEGEVKISESNLNMSVEVESSKASSTVL